MSYKFNTLAIHGKNSRDDQFGSLQPGIYNSTAFRFKSQEHAASLFALKEFGNIYSRLTNPSVGALGERLAAIDGGVGAVPTSSGHAAQLCTFFNLLEPGTEIVAANKLYGGTITQLSKSFKQFGWSAKFADISNLNTFRAAINDNTRGIFVESITNPEGKIADIEKLAKIAQEAGIPLIVDNTTATPALLRPIEYGANIVVYSISKYLSGSGSIIAGAVVDGGNFDWSSNKAIRPMNEPDPAYNGISFAETFGNLAFFVRTIAVGLRDLGTTLSPTSAFQIGVALETLSLRMKRHVENGKAVADFLSKNSNVEAISYLPFSKEENDQQLLQKYFSQGIPPIFGFTLKGGEKAAEKFINSLKLVSHVANIGDAKTLAIHPYSTTHSQLSPAEKEKAGAVPGFIRLSIGLEDHRDIIEDIEQAVSS